MASFLKVTIGISKEFLEDVTSNNKKMVYESPRVDFYHHLASHGFEKPVDIATGIGNGSSSFLNPLTQQELSLKKGLGHGIIIVLMW
jgi:hypothetical protein